MDFIERYLPIFSELTESDSWGFLLIGAGSGFVFGFMLKDIRHRNRALISCFAGYALCEIIADIPMRANFLLEFILLFLGTAALGALAGIALNFPVYMLLAKKKT
jgi:hypothetical protein